MDDGGQETERRGQELKNTEKEGLRYDVMV